MMTRHPGPVPESTLPSVLRHADRLLKVQIDVDLATRTYHIVSPYGHSKCVVYVGESDEEMQQAVHTLMTEDVMGAVLQMWRTLPEAQRDKFLQRLAEEEEKS